MSRFQIPKMRAPQVTSLTLRGLIPVSIRLLLIAGFVVLTNEGIWHRAQLLIDQDRPIALVGFLGIWGISAVALLIATLQPGILMRAFWALLVALSTAASFSFRAASGTEFGIMDAINLWGMRHEAPRAMEFYSSHVFMALLVLVLGFLILVSPPVPRLPAARRWLRRLAWAPAVPVVIVAAIMFSRDGSGAQALPSQFAPLSIGVISGVSIATSGTIDRRPVGWAAEGRKVRRIVLLMDESVRYDYLDWGRGNPFTPELARLKDRMINFGPAASGSTCSAYSNVMLRFAAAREDLGGPLLSNPTIWQYAKAAGYRTVFIDAQAAFLKDPGRLHSFMTVEEAADIDGFHIIDGSVPDAELDFRLLDVMKEEMGSQEPVFIYATKNGVHFPYDRTYPASERRFQPTMSTAGYDGSGPRINSYRNGVRWSVDGFFGQLSEKIDLTDTMIIYTADHGQAFDPDRFTHCSVQNPDPREGLVPLLALSEEQDLNERLAAAAEVSRGRANHFSIVPTLLELMGYASEDIATAYEPSMFEQATAEPAFSYGDILGLFSSQVQWQPLDLTADYLETFDEPDPEQGPSRPAPWPRTAAKP